MFDTRSGFWLMASIVITSVLATAAIIVFAPDDQLTYDNFAAAIGAPMTVILPMIGILAVTSEWSQRSGLTTFTLVPHRGRVLWAKFLAAVAVGVVAMFVALVVGALGTLVGSRHRGHGPGVERHGRRVRAHRPRQRPRDAVRLHARRADPQLGGRDRRLLRLHASCCRRSSACSRRTSSGSPTCSRGSTTTSRSSCSSTACVSSEQWQHLAVSGTLRSSSRWRSGSSSCAASEVK